MFKWKYQLPLQCKECLPIRLTAQRGNKRPLQSSDYEPPLQKIKAVEGREDEDAGPWKHGNDRSGRRS